MLVLEAMDYQHNTKDRPLGQTRLDVKSLASEGADKKEGPYVSTGPLQRSDKLVSDAGKSVKGTLVYEAKFYPALHLRGVAFAPPSSALEKVVPPKGEDDDDDHASIIETEDDAVTLDEAMQLPAGAESLARNGSVKRASVAAAEGSEIARSHTKNAMSTASIATAGTNATSQSVTEGITMSKEELLKSRKSCLTRLLTKSMMRDANQVDMAMPRSFRSACLQHRLGTTGKKRGQARGPLRRWLLAKL